MFGHDNHDNNDSEIILPPANGAQAGDDDQSQNNGQDDQPNDQQNNDQNQSNEIGAPAGPPPRGTEKSGAPTDDLLDIKQNALQALTPLIDHLEQSPEEKFRTTMMMIQASDNHTLIKIAYEAAQKIGNEKERAQALLDIVNEINYFTQQSQQQG